jgi:hypothetical protein
MELNSNEQLAPMAIEKFKILGAVLSYQLHNTANLAHLHKRWAKLAVLFTW